MSDKASNTVSIVMCTCNGGRFLRRQLDTLLAQTWPVEEIIVQDDNSQDDTWDILTDYASRCPVMSIHRNNPAKGVNGNFFSAMRRARGAYIAISDQDDLWEPDKIERQMNAIGGNMLCGGVSRQFSDDGSMVSTDGRLPNINLLHLLFTSLIPGHVMLLRRELLQLLPPDDNPVYGVALYDTILSLVAASHDSIAYVPHLLVRQRRHAGALTYNPSSRCTPSASNALYIMGWSLRHYFEVRPFLQHIMASRLALLRTQQSSFWMLAEAERIAVAETERGAGAYLRLTWLFVRNRKYMFHTRGGGFMKVIRAILYPVMQMYNYRLWIKK